METLVVDVGTVLVEGLVVLVALVLTATDVVLVGLVVVVDADEGRVDEVAWGHVPRRAHNKVLTPPPIPVMMSSRSIPDAVEESLVVVVVGAVVVVGRVVLVVLVGRVVLVVELCPPKI